MKSNHTTSRENVQDIIAQHNIDINETMERVSRLEQMAETPAPAAVPQETIDSITQTVSTQLKNSLAGVGEAIKKATEASVSQVLTKHSIRIETTCTHEWSESQENKISALMDKADKLVDLVSETKITPWKRWLRNGAAIACPVVTLLFIFAIILYTDSPEYWGKRYYQVCNHPLQQKEFLLSHRSDAYESVIAFFDAGGNEKKKMKAFIRGEEQYLKRLELEKKGGKSNGQKH
ncbi:MAG: hypothetical protein II824_08325 [Bacteroidales bacterium]|nr:hypothetical protein [Bacteroidales bacterium]